MVGVGADRLPIFNQNQGPIAQALANRQQAAANFTALQAQIDGLQTRLAALETLLASVSLRDGGATVRFTGVNVQVVSGSGTTDGALNGKGNLIIGYNEDPPVPPLRLAHHARRCGAPCGACKNCSRTPPSCVAKPSYSSALARTCKPATASTA